LTSLDIRVGIIGHQVINNNNNGSTASFSSTLSKFNIQQKQKLEIIP